MKTRIICEECDSEYNIEYEQGCLSDDIRYCIICASEEIEIEDLNQEEED